MAWPCYVQRVARHQYSLRAQLFIERNNPTTYRSEVAGPWHFYSGQGPPLGTRIAAPSSRLLVKI